MKGDLPLLRNSHLMRLLKQKILLPLVLALLAAGGVIDGFGTNPQAGANGVEWSLHTASVPPAVPQLPSLYWIGGGEACLYNGFNDNQSLLRAKHGATVFPPLNGRSRYRQLDVLALCFSSPDIVFPFHAFW